MRRGVFLDRDGTVIALFAGTGYLKRTKDMRLLSGAAQAIRILNKAGYLVFITTNQAIVARGELTEKKLQAIHIALSDRLRRRGARVDAIYYCPHHPHGVVKKYRVICTCRKPKTGLLRRAASEFNVDLKKSFIVGDHTRDILAGKRAHMKTVLVATGHAGKDATYTVKPDFSAHNLLAAARIITKSTSRR